MKDPKKFIRIMCLILVAVMVLGLIPAIAFAAGGQQTVLLTNTAGWSTPYIYFWSDSNTGMTSWPGQPMSLLEGNIYYHSIPADATYVIFSDGNGTQTSDLTIPQGMNHFNYGTGSWSVYEGGDFCVHSYDGGTVTTAPTCISTGVRTYTCTKCGDIRTEDVAQTSHSYVNGICTGCGAAKPTVKTVFYENVDGWSIVNLYYWSESNTGMVQWPGVPMTLYEGNIWTGTVPAEAQFVIFNNGDGQQTGDLTLPGNGYLYSYSMWFPYLLCEHSYGSGVITKAPTCEEEGETTFACTLCGETTTEPIPATGHSYENDICTVCGAIVECAEHTWDDGTVTQEATCWLDGAMTYTCTVCKRTKDERIPGGHKLYISDVLEPTCTKTGKEYTKCYGCAYSMDRTLPKIDHSYTIPGATVAPTCTEDGYTVYACTGCGAEQNGDLVYHTGHKWSGNTCTACGTTCAHNYVDGVCRNCDAGGPAYVKGWYEISNAAQLRWFASQVNSGNNGINGRLIADIDLAGSYWTAIGYYCSDTLTPNTMPYTGTFDGQGHTVSNFVSNGTDNEGLFGYCESATIMNVGVTGAKITGWRAGAVVGYALTSTVTDCFAKDCTITGKTSNSVALLSGAVYIAPITCPQSGTVSNCYAVDCKLVDSTDLMVETCPVGGLIRSNNYYSNVTF
ncbi:MAG: starch-binding protein, partial [Oscillospiraceae bacterium]|nr:starch-binding protein [Oscillospiraceae bacterium]